MKNPLKKNRKKQPYPSPFDFFSSSRVSFLYAYGEIIPAREGQAAERKTAAQEKVHSHPGNRSQSRCSAVLSGSAKTTGRDAPVYT